MINFSTVYIQMMASMITASLSLFFVKSRFPGLLSWLCLPTSIVSIFVQRFSFEQENKSN